VHGFVLGSRLQQNRSLFAFCCFCKFDLFTFFSECNLLLFVGPNLRENIFGNVKFLTFFLSGNLIFVFKFFVVVLNHFDFYAFPFDKFV